MPAAATKPTAKKSTAKKSVAKRATAKTRTSTAKTSTAKTSTAKTTVTKKTTAKNSVAETTVTKRTTAKKANARKANAKKATARKATAKNATAKKATAKQAAAVFSVRSIQAAIDRLRASRPGEVLHAAAEFEHYDSIGAWSFDPVGRWAPSPPFSVLYQQRNPQGHSAAVLEDPKKLVNYANFGGAIATWNAHGTGRWAHAPGAWILVEVTLVQEQADDDFDDDGGSVVAVVFALWRVLEGWAAAVWRPRERELLAQMIGLGRWPTAGWQDCTVWYGE